MATDEESATLTQSVLGKNFSLWGPLKRFMGLSVPMRAGVVAALLGSLVLVPYLGAVGLWDPWETHYGEVAREMIQRNDYVHPYWENAWFFSKPAFSMWMMAAGMKIFGSGIANPPNSSNDALVPPDALGLYTEWGFRLPFVLFSVFAVALLAYALTRVLNARVGLATAFVLLTMPLYFLISRQAVTDTPMIAANIAAMACAIVGFADSNISQKKRDWFWVAFWIFVSVGTLAKESLGVVPVAVVAVFTVVSFLPLTQRQWYEHVRWLIERAVTPILVALPFAAVAYGLFALAFGAPPNPIEGRVGLLPGLFVFLWVAGLALHRWVRNDSTVPALFNELFKMRLGSGLLIFMAVGLPWYWVMFSFPQVDDESKLFWYRVLVHDNFGRLASGVHTTTPGGSFTYFIEQGGFATYPWSLCVPGAFAVIARLSLRGNEAKDKVGLLAAVWVAFTFLLMGSSATKFHHYVLPMLPPLAILIGLFIDRLWVEGIAKHAFSLVLGLPFFVLVGKDLASNPKNFTDLFVYNYDRPYPHEMVQAPVNILGTRALWWADLLTIALMGVGGYLYFDTNSSSRPAPLKGLAVTLGALGLGMLLISATDGRNTPMLPLGIALAASVAWFFFQGPKEPGANTLLMQGCALLLAAPALMFIGKGIQVEAARGRGGPGVDDALQPLLTATVNTKETLGFAFAVAGILVVFMVIARAKVALFSASLAMVMVWTLWFNWSHWVQLSHHWTQRDQFWRYFAQRKADEPITAFLMNWRGETFYSRNTVKQIRENNALYNYAQQPGREWALVEHNRLRILEGAVGPDKKVSIIEKDLNNKFVLVTIE